MVSKEHINLVFVFHDAMLDIKVYDTVFSDYLSIRLILVETFNWSSSHSRRISFTSYYVRRGLKFIFLPRHKEWKNINAYHHMMSYLIPTKECNILRSP